MNTLHTHLITVNSKRDIDPLLLKSTSQDQVFKLNRNSFILFTEDYRPTELEKKIKRMIEPSEEYLIADVGAAQPLCQSNDPKLKELLRKAQGGL